METELTDKVRQQVQACVEQGKCLCCDRPALKRGLCHQCYYQWRSRREGLGTDEERARYDESLTQKGKLLVPQAVRALRSSSVFDDTAREVSNGQ